MNGQKPAIRPVSGCPATGFSSRLGAIFPPPNAITVYFSGGMAFVFSWKTSSMRTVAAILIVLGIVMIFFRGFNLQTEKKVVDIGPVEVNKKENHWVGWPVYAGGVAIVAGVVMLVAGRKQNA
jgi:hypothetical protein